MWITYCIITAILLAAELIYFRIADYYNIIDKPNERSSHSTIVLRGGGIIFTISMIVWTVMMVAQGQDVVPYLPFLCGLLLIAGVSFWDDVKSLPDAVRLVVQFLAMALMLYPIINGAGLFSADNWYWGVLLFWVSLIVCVGGTNIINFMDGINGITAGYSLAVLIPLLLVNRSLDRLGMTKRGLEMTKGAFVDESYLIVAIIGVLVFCIFNFRPKGRAKCFAGDVGSIGIAFILLFAIGKLIFQTGDITYIIFLLIYGVDSVLTICHRVMLHENLGQAHRKHAYQIMANELHIGHVKISLLYMALQLTVSLGFIYLIPNTVLVHWIYAVCVGLAFAAAYIVFMKKNYHLHEEYLASLKI